MVDLKNDMVDKKVVINSQVSENTPKPKLRFYGVEMIEKEVKPLNSTGRVYLPSEWVGKVVKIIRID